MIQFLLLTGHVAVEVFASEETGSWTSADDDVVREAVDLHEKLISALAAP